MSKLRISEKIILLSISLLSLFSLLSCALIVFSTPSKQKIHIWDEIPVRTIEPKKEVSEVNPPNEVKISEEEINKALSYDTYLSIINDIKPFSDSKISNQLSFEFLIKNKKIKNSNIKCTPNFYGLTDEQAQNLFKIKTFKDCDLDKTNPIKAINNNTITAVCDSRSGNYFLGSKKEDERLGSIKLKLNWKRFFGTIEIDLEDREYAVVKCGYGAKQAMLINKFSKSASDRALNLTNFISLKLGIKRPKPLGVYIIMQDSVSRFHFYRNLVSTVEYLNSFIHNSSNYAVYDFVSNSAYGFNTRPNLVPLLLGQLLGNHSKITAGLKNDNQNDYKYYNYIQNKYSVWKHFENLGFVTMFGYDTVWNYFCDDIGKIVYTDHVVLNFWSFARLVWGYSDFLTKQRCLGTKNAHRYLLDYFNQFIKNYPEHNKFAYMHISVAHEDTCTVYPTVDNDLKETLKEFVEYYENNDEDFVLMIAGDHGKGILNNIYEEGNLEKFQPLHLVIANQGLINRIGKDTHEILKHNTERLVGRFDWYVTLKHLAVLPYGNLGVESSTYKNFVYNTDSNNNAVSLLLEKIPDKRTCEDINVNDEYCLCGTLK